MTTTLSASPNDSQQPLDSGKYPVLSRIGSPADLRTMSIEELQTLCSDIRRFLISELSHNPGHFGSSMGAVELTVALHYVFNTPYDRIVWDVGHQAYGHKLLTGRASRFHTNRTLGGLSGFPTPAESEYDTFSAGHASNSISAALGIEKRDTGPSGCGGDRRRVDFGRSGVRGSEQCGQRKVKRPDHSQRQ